MSVNSQVARNQSRQTFDSVYEATNSLTKAGGNRNIEWFSGNALNTNGWTLNGTENGGMVNVIDGGYKILPTNGQNIIWYKGKNFFNYVNSGFITVIRGFYVGGGRTDILVGLSGSNEFSGVPIGSHSKCCFKQDTGAIALAGSTSNGSSETNTALAGSLTMYGERVCLKATTHSAHSEFSKNGILGVVITTNLPDSKMSPACEVRNIGTGTGNAYAYWNYMEAWNH